MHKDRAFGKFVILLVRISVCVNFVKDSFV